MNNTLAHSTLATINSAVCSIIIIFLADIKRYKTAGKVTSTEDPCSYDLPQIGNSTHRSSLSTGRLRYTLGSVGRRIANWFNDSFEDEDSTEDQNATHAHLSTNAVLANIAQAERSSLNEARVATTEENLYDSVDEALASCSASQAGILECPEDARRVNQGGESYEDMTIETSKTANGVGSTPNTGDIYSCLDEVTTEQADIYEDITSESSKFTNNTGSTLNAGNINGSLVQIYEDVTTEMSSTGKFSNNVSSTGDIYSCLEEVTTEETDTYEAIDRGVDNSSPLDIYNSFQ